jgi:hypothetical protein
MGQLVPIPITPAPGVVATDSLRAVIGRWTLPWNWFRFYRGRIQKKGGWIQAFAAATLGTPRALLAWKDYANNNYLAAGTSAKLYYYDSAGTQNDITPFRATGTLTNPFSTVANSSTVRVTHNLHGVNVGDIVHFTAVASAVGGIPAAQLVGVFPVASLIDLNNFTFVAPVAAASTQNLGGGSVSYQYEISLGAETNNLLYGWGVGGWGQGTWGTPRATSTYTADPRVWGLEAFGKLLLASDGPGGSLYSFDPTQPEVAPRAKLVAGAPNGTIRAIVVTPEEYVLALCDGLVVNASTQGDYTTWAVTTTTTAFQRTLQNGSRLVAGRVLAPYVTLIWTDGALYSFQYTGDQFIYRSALVGRDCGLIGPEAAVTVAGIAFWMGSDNFWMFNGAVIPMPNVDDIRSYVFAQVDKTQGYQCCAVYNPVFNDIEFHITTLGNLSPTLEIDFHIPDQCWTVHSSTRGSGTHFTQGDTRPYLGDAPPQPGGGGLPSCLIYQHENTYDASGQPIATQASLGPYQLSDALQAIDIEGIRLDTFGQIGNLQMTVTTYDEVADTYADSVVEDSQVNSLAAPGSGLTDIRVAGRYVALGLAQNTAGAYTRLGNPIAYGRPTAKRR